jgi:hypothetical protein
MSYYDLIASIFKLLEEEEKRELLRNIASNIDELEHYTSTAEGFVLEEE